MTAIEYISAEAKKIQKKYPYKDWKNCIKEASIIYRKKHKKKVGEVKNHKDTKSHNVNIRVVSGTKKISGWKKGPTYIREVGEKKIQRAKNVRVYRVPKGSIYKAGTFNKFQSLAGLFDTTVITDLDTLKKQYFRLAKKYHPDAGGTTEQMRAVIEEYEKLRDKLLSGSKLTEEQKENEVIIDKELRAVVDSIIHLEGITIEIIGKWIWVGGNTYPVHKTLKAAGLTGRKKGDQFYWVYQGVESKSRGGMSMEDIRKKYGSEQIYPKGTKRISGISYNKKKLKTALMKLKKALDKRPV